MSEPIDAATLAARVLELAPPIPGAVPLPLDTLRGLEMVRGLSEDVLLSLAPGFWQRTFAAGETVFATGEYGDAACVILEGFAEVRLTGLASRERHPAASGGWKERLANAFRKKGPPRAAQTAAPRVAAGGTIVLSEFVVDARPGYQARLQPGDIFGEVTALSRYPHAADVVALTDLSCVVIPTPLLRRLKNEVEPFGETLDRLYVERTLDVHLARVDLFASLPPDARRALREQAELCSFLPDQPIVAQGDPCEAFYLVRGGHVKVSVEEGDRELAVTYLRKGDYTGEIGLLLDQPWPVSLTAIEHVELVQIGRESFRRALEAVPAVERTLWGAAVQRLKERGFALQNPQAVDSLRVAMDTGLIHGESVLLIDLDTCTKCDECVRACADTHDGIPRFVREGIRVSHFSVPTACYQCTDPVCMIGCPTGAIGRPLGTLEVLINKDTCIGCHRCVNGCPWHNIVPVPFHSRTLDRDIELATKCDLCATRSAGPACVQMCPQGSAIRVDFKDPDTVRTLFS